MVANELNRKMGMYDELTCQYPLLEGYADMQHRTFQTKILESSLEHYTITAEGELWITSEERDWVADPSTVLGGLPRSFASGTSGSSIITATSTFTTFARKTPHMTW